MKQKNIKPYRRLHVDAGGAKETPEGFKPMSTAPRTAGRIAIHGRIDTTQRNPRTYLNCTFDPATDCYLSQQGWVVMGEGWKEMEDNG